MISRRNIRIKVMQALYSIDTMENDVKPGQEIKILQKHFDQTRQLLIYMIYFITEVAKYVEKDARNKASKHLPTAEDLNINTKLAGNELVWKILEDASYLKAVKEDKIETLINKDLVRKVYSELKESPEYKKYITEGSRDKKNEKDILEFLYNDLLLPHEYFISHIEELFPNWDDDCDMINQLVTNYLSKPGSFDFQEILSKEKWNYARTLLESVLNRKEVTMEFIRPRLKNWDAERIASLDMILMEMGVCEFLYFETIPPKVTINEYIDLAKEYSTPQSGQFVNGILDNIHKELVSENKMHKVNFKK
ncbi:MAG: transcription antitermination factor NusB [Chitinophagaceae bacterium]|nr:transcription antitermination factor NusB [Chitinophagaceae bacterium]